jgi:hypothetical protein
MKHTKLSSFRFGVISMLAVCSLGLSVAKADSRIDTDKKIIAPHVDAVINDAGLDSKSVDHSDPVLIAQAPALWCYTNFGAYPMAVALPPGAVCQVNVNFYPFVIYGIAGY